MANARNKSIDNTHLSIDQAEIRGFIHRDYIAHCMRWSHVVKQMYQKNRYKTARIMDIGCGIDVPMARTLYSQRLIPELYIGVDYNMPEKFNLSAFKEGGRFPINAYGGIDFAADYDVVFDGDNKQCHIGGDVFSLPNIFTCFEVVEHIEPEHVRRLLLKVWRAMYYNRDEDPLFFLSTPNYDATVGAAKNHVNEMTHSALNCLLEDIGFVIAEQYGTFASQRDYKEQLFADYADGRDIYEELGEYYDSNYLATIFAPLYPAQARNCLRVLKLPRAGSEAPDRLYAEPGPGPWSSSGLWRELLPDRTPSND